MANQITQLNANRPVDTTQNYQLGAQNPYGVVNQNNEALPINQTAVQGVNNDELVSHQLQGLLDGNSAYIQHAQAAGQQQAASRGLLNSSMAAGMSENAAIGAALPIAQGNAQEYAAVAQANQQAINQTTGEHIAANAQLGAAATQAGAMLGSADINAETQRMGQAQQFQEYGMGLGEQYAQLAQQGNQYQQGLAYQYAGLGEQYAGLQQSGQEFNANLGYQYAGLNQSGQEFNANLGLQTQQLNQQQNQFEATQRQQIGEYQGTMAFNTYQLGVQQNNVTQQDYAQMFNGIMQNPNMTADQRASALTTAGNFFGQQSQQNAAIPAFTPPWVNDPSYWTGG